MTNEELLNVLIDIDEITTSNLLKKGISSYYISKFVSDKLIIRFERGKYRLKDFNVLYGYGKKLLNIGMYDKSFKCFQKCIEMSPEFVPSYFQTLIITLNQKDYKEFLNYLDVLSDKGFINDNGRKYLLFLLSNIINLPANYKNELSLLTFDDIKYVNYSDRNMYSANKLQGLCFKKEFYFAVQKSDKIVNGKFCSLFNVVENLLIKESYNSVKKNAQIMSQLCAEGKFEEAKNILVGEINPNKYNIYIVKLLDEIITLEKTGIPSKTTLLNASNVFEAIDGKNYSLALSLSKGDNLLKDLLKIITAKIKEIVNPITEKKEQFSLNYFTEITRDNFSDVEKEIEYIYKRLTKKRGIYIMDCFNEKTTKDLLNIFSLYPNLKVFLINYNMEDRIVVRYNPQVENEIDVRNLYTYASYYFEYGYYEECLEICLDLLQLDNPSIAVYTLLAWTYMELKRPLDARDCFMVIYDLTKSKKYFNLIAKVDGVYSKQFFEMNMEEFEEKDICKLEKK